MTSTEFNSVIAKIMVVFNAGEPLTALTPYQLQLSSYVPSNQPNQRSTLCASD
jgi:hypothetical protein